MYTFSMQLVLENLKEIKTAAPFVCRCVPLKFEK
jgi:hypothetical protein